MTTSSAPPPDREAVQKRLDQLANWLDTAFEIPGTRIRFGIDAIIGLVPGIGDAAGLALGLWVIWQARSMHAPPRLQTRMLGNLLIETVVGAVPVLGDVFDVAWRANQRNVALLREWHAPPEPEQPKPNWPRIAIATVAIAGIAALGARFWL